MKFCLKLRFSALSGQPPAWPTHDHSVWGRGLSPSPLLTFFFFPPPPTFCHEILSKITVLRTQWAASSMAHSWPLSLGKGIVSIPPFDFFFFFLHLHIFHEILSKIAVLRTWAASSMAHSWPLSLGKGIVSIPPFCFFFFPPKLILSVLRTQWAASSMAHSWPLSLGHHQCCTCHLGDFHCTKCCRKPGFYNRAESDLSAGVKPGGIESTAMTIFSIPFFDLFFSTLEIFHEIWLELEFSALSGQPPAWPTHDHSVWGRGLSPTPLLTFFFFPPPPTFFMKFCLKLRFSALSGQPPAWPTHDHSVWGRGLSPTPLLTFFFFLHLRHFSWNSV